MSRQKIFEEGLAVGIEKGKEELANYWIGRGREKGFAYWNHDGSPLTEEQLVGHVAHNAVANGVTDISQLDGWADFPRGAVTFRVSDVEAS